MYCCITNRLVRLTPIKREETETRRKSLEFSFFDTFLLDELAFFEQRLVPESQRVNRRMNVRIGRRVSRGMLPLLALHTLSEYYRSERKPPVTAGLIAANTLIYLRPSFLESVIPSIDEVWFNPYLILKVSFFFFLFVFFTASFAEFGGVIEEIL